MNELAVGQVDADMVDPLFLVAKEDQIAGLQVACGDLLQVRGSKLVHGVVRQINAEQPIVDHSGKTGTVEAPGRGSTLAVGDTEEFFGFAFKLMLGQSIGGEQRV